MTGYAYHLQITYLQHCAATRLAYVRAGFSEVKVNLHMVWPRQRVDAIRLASTDEIALGISSHHNFRTD